VRALAWTALLWAALVVSALAEPEPPEALRAPAASTERQGPPLEKADPNTQPRASEGDNRPGGDDRSATQPMPQPAAGIDGANKTPSNDGVSTGGKKYSGCEYDNVEEYDLTAQQNMAESTVWINRSAWITALLTLVGLGLITGTLVYTARAAGHAKIAADAALATVREARKTTRHLRKELALSHPPRFNITRPIAFEGNDRRTIPKFNPGDAINGQAFAINHGRFDATIIEDKAGKFDADCYFFWSPSKSVPMTQAYIRHSKRADWTTPDRGFSCFPRAEAGQYFS
jgi:hypothetical protein